MTRCITNYLVHEHQEFSHLLYELQEQLGVLPLARDHRSTAERLRGLTRAVAQALHTHVVEEEEILYPALADHLQGIAATLDRMRREHDTGEETEKVFQECVERLIKGGRNRQEVMQRGRQYVQWLRGHLFDENGRLFPMVERGLDTDTQQEVRRAMEELVQETSARIAEGSGQAARI
jgi:hemerythrin-like domain-containing protein